MPRPEFFTPQQWAFQEDMNFVRTEREEEQFQERLEVAAEAMKYPLLWDEQHPDHKNSRKRSAVWKAIAEQLGVPKPAAQWTQILKFRTRLVAMMQREEAAQ